MLILFGLVASGRALDSARRVGRARDQSLIPGERTRGMPTGRWRGSTRIPLTVHESRTRGSPGSSGSPASSRPSARAGTRRPISTQFIRMMLSTSELMCEVAHHRRHAEHFGVLVVVDGRGLMLLHQRDERVKEVAEHPPLRARGSTRTSRCCRAPRVSAETPPRSARSHGSGDRSRSPAAGRTAAARGPDRSMAADRCRCSFAFRITWGTCSSSVSMRLRSPRRAPSAMNCSAMTLLPTPEMPATTVVLPRK